MVQDAPVAAEDSARPVGERPVAVQSPSFEVLYRDYFVMSWRTLRALGVAPHVLEDTAQELWVVVHRRLAEFEGRSTLKTWLFGIALNVARNARRNQARDQRVTPLDVEITAAEPDAAAHYQGRQAWRLVEAFLSTLDPERREIFVCALLEGLSAPELALITGLGTEVIYNRIRALRRSFRTWAQHQRYDL